MEGANTNRTESSNGTIRDLADNRRWETNGYVWYINEWVLPVIVVNHFKQYPKIAKKTIPNYRYADEREWRFVPPIKNGIDHRPFVPLNRINTKEKKDQLNERVKQNHLTFKPDDIKYLIVKNDSEINEMIKHLRSVKHRFKAKVIDRLTSRILTSEQIMSDI